MKLKKAISLMLVIFMLLGVATTMIACNETPVQGEKGEDGLTPYIGENGNWWIGDKDTGVNAQGIQGIQGEKGDKGDQGEQGIQGEKGENGNTPYIGENGNWWIGDIDTGISATGGNTSNTPNVPDIPDDPALNGLLNIAGENKDGGWGEMVKINTTVPSVKSKEYRILLTSDVHYTSINTYYEMDSDTRIRMWLDGVLEEHANDPFDLIIIAGDISLDYWGWKDGGTYQKDPPVSETAVFIKKYVSQLPQDVPIIVLPGNHELYTNEKWNEITGNNRNESFVLGDNLFVMPDSFSGAVDPEYIGDGVNDSPYEAVDMEFIQSQIDNNPQCKNIFIISHHINLAKESDEFKEFLKNEKRIVALFAGHTHMATIKELGDEYGGLCIAQTGSFATAKEETVEDFSFGFRDLIIKENEVITSYIMPDCYFYIDGVKYWSERNISDIKVIDLNDRKA